MSDLEATDTKEEPVMARQDVTNMLIAIGVNTCFRSYDSTHKKLSESFLSMSIKEIAPTWEHLDNNVKLEVINRNIDSFRSWINGGQ